MKILVSLLMLLCFASVIHAQNFQTYQQTIPGSSVAFKMVAIPGGSFLMGSPDKQKENEGPQTEIRIDSFWIGEHEVTFDEYVMFRNRELDKAPVPDAITRPSPPYIDFTQGMGKEGGYPANSMSQHAALMYCKWLYEKTGVFYRLPTEAEWEYACRAGSTTAYPSGDDTLGLSKYAWYKSNSGNKYHKVKEKAPNAWGLYDMAGNVAEWTLDQYDPEYFKHIKNDNPQIPVTKKYPVTLKGGHFQSAAEAVRSASRLPSDKKWNARDPQIPKSLWWIADAPFVGFRILRPIKQPTKAAIEQFFNQVLNGSK